MRLLRLRDDDIGRFAEVAEVCMDCHIARSSRSNDCYLVIGSRVSIPLNEITYAEPEWELLGQPWLGPRMTYTERSDGFERWLGNLKEAPQMTPATPQEAWSAFLSAFSPV